MTEQQIIDWLFTYGHFRNPAYQECHNITENDLTKLSYNDQVVKSAIKSFQEIDANTDVFGQAMHKRNIIADGNIGPATIATIALPRCGCADYLPQATGSGSWPTGCVSGYEEYHSVYVNIEADMPSWWKNNWTEISDNLIRMMHEVGQHVVFRVGNVGQGHMNVRFRRLSGSTIGINDVPYDPDCSDRISGSIDSTWDARSHMLTILGCHEWFVHGNGLGHSRGGIGNPSVLDVPLSWKGDPFENKMLKFFGGPIDPDKPEPSPDPPPPDPTPPAPLPPPAPISWWWRAWEWFAWFVRTYLQPKK